LLQGVSGEGGCCDRSRYKERSVLVQRAAHLVPRRLPVLLPVAEAVANGVVPALADLATRSSGLCCHRRRWLLQAGGGGCFHQRGSCCKGLVALLQRFIVVDGEVVAGGGVAGESNDGASGRRKCYQPLPEMLRAATVLLRAVVVLGVAVVLRAAVEAGEFRRFYCYWLQSMQTMGACRW
jgi:hypothetical protein